MFRNPQHRGHKEPQRTSEKLTCRSRPSISHFSVKPSVLSVAFLCVLRVKFRKTQPKMQAFRWLVVRKGPPDDRSPEGPASSVQDSPSNFRRRTSTPVVFLRASANS